MFVTRLVHMVTTQKESKTLQTKPVNYSNVRSVLYNTEYGTVINIMSGLMT